MADKIAPRAASVEIAADVTADPPTIVLHWHPDPCALTYTLYRRLAGESGWGPAVPLDLGANSFADADVAVDTLYEYRIDKTGRQFEIDYVGHGYLCSGIQIAAVHHRGTALLIVEADAAQALTTEIATLVADLAGDGWTVHRHDVARTDSPQSVKELIRAEYEAAGADVRCAFLLGHVPVPYSGHIAPDGHAEHRGAWPADAFYGDMTGEWTDSIIDIATADREPNRNVPGDGKFDQSTIPGPVAIEIGRVDMANLPAFAPLTEIDLLRQYLARNHAFRTGQLTPAHRAFISDRFGYLNGLAFSASGWSHASAMLGRGRSENGTTWFPAMETAEYLLAYACGPGSYTSCGGIVTTDDFVKAPSNAAFTMLFGSFFGDWDAENSLLRAPLAAKGMGLACAWSGFPRWHFHPLAMGATLGHCARLTQNCRPGGDYPPTLGSEGLVHIALMGDPTLHMSMPAPPEGVTAARHDGRVHVRWAATDDNAAYYIYTSPSTSGTFTRLTDEPITAAAYDFAYDDETVWVLVRSVKLEVSGSGSYFSLSQGAIGAA